MVNEETKHNMGGHCVCLGQVLLSLAIESQMVIFDSQLKEIGARIVASNNAICLIICLS